MAASKRKSTKKASPKHHTKASSASQPVAESKQKKTKARKAARSRSWSLQRCLRGLISLIAMINMISRMLHCPEGSTSAVCTTVGQTMLAIQTHPYYTLYAKDTIEPLVEVAQLVYYQMQDSAQPLTRTLRTQRDAFDRAWVQPGRRLWYRHGHPWVKAYLPHKTLRQWQATLTHPFHPNHPYAAQLSKEMQNKANQLKRMMGRVVRY